MPCFLVAHVSVRDKIYVTTYHKSRLLPKLYSDTDFLKYSVSSLIASVIRPFAFNIAIRRFLGAALVSSLLIIESRASNALSNL